MKDSMKQRSWVHERLHEFIPHTTSQKNLPFPIQRFFDSMHFSCLPILFHEFAEYFFSTMIHEAIHEAIPLPTVQGTFYSFPFLFLFLHKRKKSGFLFLYMI